MYLQELAKQYDGTFDIDQHEANSGPMLLQQGVDTMRNLNEQELRDEEFQLVDTDVDQNDSWLVKSVQRVRRELGRLFGNEETPSSSAEDRKTLPPSKSRLRKRHQNSDLNRLKKSQVGKKRRHSPPVESVDMEKKSSQFVERHKKRNLDMQDDDFDGSGMPEEIDDYETEQCRIEYSYIIHIITVIIIVILR